MIVCVNSLFNQIAALADNDKAALDENIGFFPLSAKGNIGTVIPEQNNSVVAFKTSDSKKEAAARQFINYWMTEDYETFVKDQALSPLLKTWTRLTMCRRHCLTRQIPSRIPSVPCNPWPWRIRISISTWPI